MCMGCWHDYGAPREITPEIKEAAALVAKVYESSVVGGNAHIVLDDWNIEDDSIDWCLETALRTNIHEHSAEELAVERQCLEALKALGLKERASALALHDGFFGEDTATQGDGS